MPNIQEAIEKSKAAASAKAEKAIKDNVTTVIAIMAKNELLIDLEQWLADRSAYQNHSVNYYVEAWQEKKKQADSTRRSIEALTELLFSQLLPPNQQRGWLKTITKGLEDSRSASY